MHGTHLRLLFRSRFPLLMLWTLWFIFHYALEPGALSSARSQAVTDPLNRLLAVGLLPMVPRPKKQCVGTVPIRPVYRIFSNSFHFVDNF